MPLQRARGAGLLRGPSATPPTFIGGCPLPNPNPEVRRAGPVMCNESCILFVARHLERGDVEGRRVIELGAGGIGARPLLREWEPAEYVTVDIHPGPGVDLVCSAEELGSRFEAGRFDVVLSTEMLEHVRDWRKVIAGIKQVLKPGGKVVLTTRSLGYPFHAAPHDYWRFEPADMQRMFSDFDAVRVETDLQEPGVFLAARKPLTTARSSDLSTLELYSMVEHRRTATIPTSPPGRVSSARMVWAARLKNAVHAITETLRGRPPGMCDTRSTSPNSQGTRPLRPPPSPRPRPRVGGSRPHRAARRAIDAFPPPAAGELTPRADLNPPVGSAAPRREDRAGHGVPRGRPLRGRLRGRQRVGPSAQGSRTRAPDVPIDAKRRLPPQRPRVPRPPTHRRAERLRLPRTRGGG